MHKGIFATGTDTDIGKTFVSGLIAQAFLRRNIRTIVVKPIATGGRKLKGQCISPDTLYLKKKLNLPQQQNELNPVCFSAPLAPLSASRIEKKTINIKNVLKSVEHAAQNYDQIIVEGIGGVSVPITKDYFVSNLIKDIGFPVIIVARSSLGTINHTLLTINELERRGISILGVIYNDCTRTKKGLAQKTSPRIISECSKVPILGEIPYVSEKDTKGYNALADMLYTKIMRRLRVLDSV
ncbi:MAG: dethiobiotin synthase [Candidatus Ancaeobacter aquaticus]|nr:dethiobiotin synthase [Candidatus Ancaeobacter aquaticus]